MATIVTGKVSKLILSELLAERFSNNLDAGLCELTFQLQTSRFVFPKIILKYSL
jgi:hypothetical protein